MTLKHLRVTNIHKKTLFTPLYIVLGGPRSFFQVTLKLNRTD